MMFKRNSREEDLWMGVYTSRIHNGVDPQEAATQADVVTNLYLERLEPSPVLPGECDGCDHPQPSNF